MPSDLANKLNTAGLERKHVILLLLNACTQRAMPKDLKDLGGQYGFQKIKKWNLSQILSGLQGMVAHYPDGWAITDHGKSELAELGLADSSPTKTSQVKLRETLKAITDEHTKTFIIEAIEALEYGLIRSAIVLSWVGAVSVMHKYVADQHLGAFNQEAQRRDAKAKLIKNVDGLQQVKEHDFLQIACAIGVFDKNVKGELEGCLKLRNSCGHPNRLRVGEHKVASHLETLMLNVYEVYA